jgi:hypothetical protein
VIGDMSSRPNWGLNELDFVFATLVVSTQKMLQRRLYASKLPATNTKRYKGGASIT